MANIPNRASVKPPARRFKVHAPRTLTEDDFTRFVSNLNKELGAISDKIAKIPVISSDFDPDDYVLAEDLPGLIAVNTAQDDDELSSEGSTGGSTPDTTSEGDEGGSGGENAEAATENAIPTVQPPKVTTAGGLGTVGDQVMFALYDHSHIGVNLDDAQTIVGVKTFNADVFFGPTSKYDFSDDRLGIGTTTPVSSLEIVNDGSIDAIRASTTGAEAKLRLVNTGTTGFAGSTFSSDTSAAILSSFCSAAAGSAFGVTRASTNSLRYAGGLSFVGTSDANALAFGTNDVERARFLSSGELGIKTTTPNTVLDVNGDFALRESTMTLVNGGNNDVSTLRFSMWTITGPVAAFSTTGFADGFNGKLLTVYNPTAQAWTIANLNAGSAAANQITTMTGADVVLAASISVAVFQYDAGSSTWLLLSARDSAGAH